MEGVEGGGVNEDGTFYVCEACQERVEPGEAGIIAARELITTPSFGDEPDEPIEGFGVFFHAHHYPSGSPRYRRVS